MGVGCTGACMRRQLGCPLQRGGGGRGGAPAKVMRQPAHTGSPNSKLSAIAEPMISARSVAAIATCSRRGAFSHPGFSLYRGEQALAAAAHLKAAE